MATHIVRLPWWLSGKNSTCQCRRHRFNPWVRKVPWKRKWQHTPVFLLGKPHGQRKQVDYSPWVRVGYYHIRNWTAATELNKQGMYMCILPNIEFWGFSLDSMRANLWLFLFCWFLNTLCNFYGFPGGSDGNLPAMQETPLWFLGWEDPLEWEMATHSSIFAWRIPWTEEPGRLQSVWSQRVGHNLVTDRHFHFI